MLANDDTEVWSGRWRERLGVPSTTPLHVELGCNAGHVIREWARARPDEAFIGVDWKYKQVFRGFEKSTGAGLSNVMFLRAKAERFPLMFGAGEITSLSVFFPDPWPKKRHHKHRYLTAEWLTAARGRIAHDGFLHIKTDHGPYFEEILSAVASTPWHIAACTRDLHAGHPNPQAMVIPEVTLFERLFIAKGLPIYSMKLV